jgi:hypothetical protein
LDGRTYCPNFQAPILQVFKLSVILPDVTFQDFLEHFYSALKKGVPAGLGVPAELAPLGGYDRIRALVEQAHVFHLEAPGDEAAFMKEVGQDAVEDLQNTIPVPFDSFAIVQEEGDSGHWQFRWVLRLAKAGAWSGSNNLFEGDNHFLLWVYSSAAGRPPDFFSSMRFQYLGGKGIEVRLSLDSVQRFAQGLQRTSIEAQAALQSIVTGILLEIGAISHPANYILERTPALSPREERQGTRGESRPFKKRNHFIVVDHDQLMELNPATRSSTGMHASPIPHARRGHWRRLAEGCSKARAEGKTKVWVGPTYVGEREFGDEKNWYRLLLHSTQRETVSTTGVPPTLEP